MKLKALIIGWIFILTFGLSACGGSPTAAPATEDNKSDRLSTAVAGTLTAAAPVPTDTATPAPTATSTAEPTRQPGPLRVVYSRAGSIWVWTEGGQPKQLTNNIVDAKPRLSDDGQWIVFERNNELYKVRPDGSDLKVLVSDAFLKPYLPSGHKFIWAEYYDWMPNSHFVYFTTKTGISGPESDILQYDLFRADVDSDEVKQLVAPGSGGVPYFSTDGKTVGMVQPEAVYLADIDGKNVRKALSFTRIPTEGGPGELPFLVPLPKNGSFRMAIPGNWYANPNGRQAELWEIPNQGDPIRLSKYEDNYLFLDQISPDGNLLMHIIKNSFENYQLCILHVDTGKDQCINYEGKFIGIFFFSPDSKKFISYGFDIAKGQGGLYLQDIDFGHQSPIISSSNILWVDANQYLYRSQNLDLYLTTLDGDSQKIANGISDYNYGDRWHWQFDYSY